MAMSEKEKINYRRKFNEEKYERIGMYLPPEQKKQWERAAKERSMNLSQFIKFCVSKQLEE